MKEKIKNNYPIMIIMIFAAFLYTFNIAKQGYANQYYAAGVYSMGQNLHAFFFNSLDSVGFVTIDKPPLGFWIQTLFTKVFGFNGFVLILPEIICAVLSIYLVYRMVSKRMDKASGLVAASVLALTPIFCAVARNNTIDSILILCMLLASSQAIIASETGRSKHILFAGILMGIGFNIKMLQAYMIVPAVYLIYLIFSKQKFVKKILISALSIVIMLLISLSWIVTVDLIDEQNRPYVGSSEENSAVELTLGHNGLSRIFGRNSGIFTNILQKDRQNNTQQQAVDQNMRQRPSQIPNSTAAGQSIDDGVNVQNQRPNDALANLNQSNMPSVEKIGTDQVLLNDGMQTNMQNPPMDRINMPIDQQRLNGTNMQNARSDSRQNSFNRTNISNNKGGGGEAGEASLFRLYNSSNAGQIAWFIVPSVLSVLLIFVLLIKKKLHNHSKSIVLVFFALCFVSMFVYFSFSGGLAHRYYFATFAPFIAGFVGAGYYYLKKSNRWVMMTVFVLTAASQVYIHRLYDGWLDMLVPIFSVGFVVIAGLIALSTRFKWSNKIVLGLICSLLLLPAIWAATPMLYSDNSQLPIAGPELVSSDDIFDTSEDYSEVISYLKQHQDGATYLVAVPSSMQYGSLMILQSEGNVMVLGGFNGGDTILTCDEFIQMVKDNAVNYAVFNNDNKNSNQEIYQWIQSEGHLETTIDGLDLYRLDENQY